MRQVSKEINLADASISSLIAKFAFPAILANLVGSIYNIADQIFIGQKMGTVGNAATNIAFPLVLLMTMFSTMLGSGGSSQFSLYQGAGENKKAGKIVGNSLVALVISGVGLMAGTLLFLRPLMGLFGAKGETLELAIEYTRVIAIGMPFQIFGAGASMFIRADGSPKYAMTSTLAGAILNVILDPVFIFGMNMGMTGAALATIIGQIIGALIALSYFRKFKSVELKQEAFIPRFSCLKGICILGLPAGLMQIAVMIVQIVMNNTLGYYGEQTIYGRDIPLAVSGVVTKINSIFTATVMGICQSCQPIFGYNYGAKNFKRVNVAMIEVVYCNDNENEETDEKSEIRIRKAPGNGDISGDYTEYSEISTVTIENIQVSMKGENGKIQLATWTNGDYTYSIGFYFDTGISSGDLNGFITSVQ